MRIGFLTTDDPLYLPAFFDHVLAALGRDADAVWVAPPLYKNQTPRAAAVRYYRTFGAGATVALATRVARAKATRQSIAATCRRHGVHCADVPDVNAGDFLDGLERRGTDLLVSVSCPQIFGTRLISLPPMGCLNIHGAILPQYRGVMPSFWMLANGERQAGVTIYYVNEAIDAGAVCGRRVFDIPADDTLDSFIRRSKRIAAELLLETLDDIRCGTVLAEPLDVANGSYYSWPTRDAVARFRGAGRSLW